MKLWKLITSHVDLPNNITPLIAALFLLNPNWVDTKKKLGNWNNLFTSHMAWN